MSKIDLHLNTNTEKYIRETLYIGTDEGVSDIVNMLLTIYMSKGKNFDQLLNDYVKAVKALVKQGDSK